jgi:hypothetical protein
MKIFILLCTFVMCSYAFSEVRVEEDLCNVDSLKQSSKDAKKKCKGLKKQAKKDCKAIAKVAKKKWKECKKSKKPNKGAKKVKKGFKKFCKKILKLTKKKSATEDFKKRVNEKVKGAACTKDDFKKLKKELKAIKRKKRKKSKSIKKFKRLAKLLRKIKKLKDNGKLKRASKKTDKLKKKACKIYKKHKVDLPPWLIAAGVDCSGKKKVVVKPVVKPVVKARVEPPKMIKTTSKAKGDYKIQVEIYSEHLVKQYTEWFGFTDKYPHSGRVQLGVTREQVEKVKGMFIEDNYSDYITTRFRGLVVIKIIAIEKE